MNHPSRLGKRPERAHAHSYTRYITGAHGFVGSNLTTYLGRDKRHHLVSVGRSGSDLTYDDFRMGPPEPGSTIIHLAGKAHDLRGTTNLSEYDEANFALTKRAYDWFNESEAAKFIFVSSVKAVADTMIGRLTESTSPKPTTAYGISKLKAENYLRQNSHPDGRATYILRPCMIHGPGNKGNLNLLYGLVARGIPYPLGAFHNERSLLTVENLCFAIEQLATRNISPGTYNVADDFALSMSQIIVILAESAGRSPVVLSPPRAIVNGLARIGDILRLPLNSISLQKLTENYVVSNDKLLHALGRSCMPISASSGLSSTASALFLANPRKSATREEAGRLPND